MGKVDMGMREMGVRGGGGGVRCGFSRAISRDIGKRVS